MSYLTHATISGDRNIRLRLLACAAQEGVSTPGPWVNAHALHLVGSDWIAAWEYAVAAGGDPDSIGADEAVVTDGMILSAVQARMA